MTQTLCDRCGTVVPEVKRVNEIKRTYLKKSPNILLFRRSSYSWDDVHLVICDDCRREFDEWLKEKGSNPCQS